ncbi:hypothetical protein CF326_g8036 [Tilletia indica]|nr:hypothetical protein CF326_g8036 [Tilletia indica]
MNAHNHGVACCVGSTTYILTLDEGKEDAQSINLDLVHRLVLSVSSSPRSDNHRSRPICPNHDTISTFLAKHIPPHIRPARDTSGTFPPDEIPHNPDLALAMRTNAWRRIAVYTSDRIISAGAPPSASPERADIEPAGPNDVSTVHDGPYADNLSSVFDLILGSTSSSSRSRYGSSRNGRRSLGTLRILLLLKRRREANTNHTFLPQSDTTPRAR